MSNSSRIKPGLFRTPMVRLGCSTIGGTMMLFFLLARSLGQSPLFIYVLLVVILLGLIFFSIGLYRYISLKKKLGKQLKSEGIN